MSGLDVAKHKIIEIAVVITDTELNILAEGPNMVIFQTPEHMDNMNEWCITNHAKTGLTDLVLESKITEIDAEKAVIDFISQWVEPGESPMCGNSIGTDREFIKYHMNNLYSWFHYRNFDVSSLKMASAWWPKQPKLFEKQVKGQHRALHDIVASIEEARYYMNEIYKK